MRRVCVRGLTDSIIPIVMKRFSVGSLTGTPFWELGTLPLCISCSAVVSTLTIPGARTSFSVYAMAIMTCVAHCSWWALDMGSGVRAPAFAPPASNRISTSVMGTPSMRSLTAMTTASAGSRP